MKNGAKKALRALVCLLAALLLALAGYIAYLFLSYSRLPDLLPLTVENGDSAAPRTETKYSLLSFNVGFGAYEPDFGFFMDGGTESRFPGSGWRRTLRTSPRSFRMRKRISCSFRKWTRTARVPIMSTSAKR